MKSPPLAPRDVLRLQASIGNRAVSRLARGAPAPVAAVAVAGSRRWAGARRRTNRALDAVPRPWLRGGLPSFRAAIWLATATAVAVATTAAPLAGIPAGSFVVVSVIVVAVVVAALLVHRLPSYALQAAVLAGALAAAALLGLEVLAVLDAVAVGLGAGQVVGRIGCAMAGCCHGRPARWGHRYRPALGFPPRLVGVRLAPVQLLEAAYCAALTLTSALVLASSAAAGTAFVTQTVGYAAGRFGLEFLRGDASGGHAQRISAGVAAAVALFGAVGVLPLTPVHVAAAAALVAASALPRRRTTWIEVARALDGLPDRGAVAETPGGLRLSVVREGPLWTYGISHRAGPLQPRAARKVAGSILRLRHPDRDGVLLSRAGSFDVLIVQEERP